MSAGPLHHLDVLASRVLLHPVHPERSHHFYRDVLGLAVFREFPGGTVYFLGQGLLEVSGHAQAPPGNATGLWLQVRNVRAEMGRLRALGVPVLRPPVTEPWGLLEATISDPDGLHLVLVEVPPEHPLRRDLRQP